MSAWLDNQRAPDIRDSGEPVAGESSDVRIVAIGASAGALEPMERFFDAMPPESGLAFVVLQHLSPDFKSMMDELLARHSSMAIRRVEDGMEIEPNTIYLNSPRSLMTVAGGFFTLTKLSEPADMTLPINTFLESLAIGFGDQAIAVVLSGTGTDATIGCKAIKAAGGAVFVQDPDSAKFDGMPNSAISQDVADAIALAEELPQFILDHVAGRTRAGADADADVDPLQIVFRLMRERFGADFSYYKTSTVDRRVRRRAEMRGFSELGDYVETLTADREEVDALYNGLLIEVTAFFRDADAFRIMKQDIIPQIAANMSADRQIRVWVPGCASGEEAYSLAILLSEYARTNDVPLNVKILATDIHNRSLDSASSGIYSEEALKNLPTDIVRRYFVSEGPYFQVSQSLRKLTVFSQHNILRDPPFTRMDLVSCRNVLIYFNDVAQQKALALFHFALNQGGCLFLGPSETVGKLSGEFTMLDQRWRIYRKLRNIRLAESTTVLPRDGTMRGAQNVTDLFLRPAIADNRSRRPDAQRAINDALHSLLVKYAPTGFLLNRKGEILHIFGDAGTFLQLGEGGFSRRVVDLIHGDLKLVVGAALERTKGRAVLPFKRQVPMSQADGATIDVLVALEGLQDAEGGNGHLLLTLERRQAAEHPDASEPEPDAINAADAAGFLQQRIDNLENDLQSTEESLQTTIEELETSNEELQATNEELMASNEELQSTNEELHSVNEELYTVSSEHQRKIEELTEVTNDMDHLLKSTEIGTIFLDSYLRIRKFTPAANKTFNLMSQDVGRPIDHITSRFKSDGIFDLVKTAHANSALHEVEVEVGEDSYLIRIQPHFKDHDGENGMVIMAIDINELRRSRREREAIADLYAGVLADLSETIVRWSAEDGTITYCNQAYADLQGAAVEDLVGRCVHEVVPEDQHDDLRKILRNLRPGQLRTFRNHQRGPLGSQAWRDDVIRAIGGDRGGVVEFQATGRDMTDEVRYRDALEALIDSSDEPDPDFELRLGNFLRVGADYLKLESGVLARVDGADYAAEFTFGPVMPVHEKDRRVACADVACKLVIESGSIVVLPDVSDSPLRDHDIRVAHGLKAYVGAPVRVNGNLYGTLSFFSTRSPLPVPPTETEIGFVRLLARWIGYKIERRNQIVALHESEQQLDLIFNNVPARIWFKDDTNRILRLNRTAAESMGVEIGAAQGADTRDLFPEMAAKHHEDDLEVIDGGKPVLGIVERYTPASGAHGWIKTDKIPHVDETTGARGVLVVTSDVTELKERELELEQLNVELDKQRDDYAALYRNTPVAMHSIDVNGNLIEVSNHWLSQLGYARDDVIGRKSTDFMTKESIELAKSVLSDFWRDGHCDAVPYQFVRKDGSLVDIELSGIVDSVDETGTRSLAVLIDVTDRNAAFTALERANEELAQANEDLKKFAYVASHDLQEPLRKIQHFGDLLTEGQQEVLDEDGKFCLQVISEASARMRRLIGDLLDLARTNNREIELTAIDLDRLVGMVLENLTLALKEAAGEIKVGKLPTIEGDETMVEQLFTNLVSNAIKYHDESRPPRVTIKSRRDRKTGGVAITIEDNGIGLDETQTTRIFEPFTRLHSEADYSGTGVGLAICRTVCDRHDWALDVESNVGKGSKFTIRIPSPQAAERRDHVRNTASGAHRDGR